VPATFLRPVVDKEQLSKDHVYRDEPASNQPISNLVIMAHDRVAADGHGVELEHELTEAAEQTYVLELAGEPLFHHKSFSNPRFLLGNSARSRHRPLRAASL
jgi:hypothetical protein